MVPRQGGIRGRQLRSMARIRPEIRRADDEEDEESGVVDFLPRLYHRMVFGDGDDGLFGGAAVISTFILFKVEMIVI